MNLKYKYCDIINGTYSVKDIAFLNSLLHRFQIMEEAHVDAVMVLGQVFDKNNKYYDFGGQDVTKR